MVSRWNRSHVVLLVLVALALLAVPMVAAAQTANGISTPANGATVSGTVTVKGYASDPNFDKWQLDLLPGGDANAAIFLAYGTTAGDFTYNFDTTPFPQGKHALRLRVVHTDGNYTEYTNSFTIGKAAAATTAPTAAATSTSTSSLPTTGSLPTSGAGVTTNGIAAPANNATIRGVVTVKGYANDPNFEKWQLDLLPGGDANAAIFLSYGTNAGAFTYDFNTTPFPQGKHALRLRVVHTDGNYTEYTNNFTLGAAGTGGAAAAATPAPTKTTGNLPTTGSPATGAGITSNGFASPVSGAKASGTLTVKGYASDPNFAKWQLDLYPGDAADAASFLALGETAGQFTYDLDTTPLAPGTYTLRLRVVRADSNYSEYFTKFTR